MVDVPDGQMTYRPLAPADGRRINHLFGRSYSRDRSLAEWRWEYADGPGGEPILWGVEADGELVGHYALIPQTMSFFGRPVKGAKAENAMVDPRYRGRGICSRLVELTLQDAAQKGIAVVWGFPNQMSFAIMERSGRIQVGGLYSYIRILRPGRVLQAFIRHRLRPSAVAVPGQPNDWPEAISYRPRTAHLASAAHIDEAFDDLWERARADAGITVERDHGYLRWRFRDNPHGRYLILVQKDGARTVSGYMISTLKNERGLRIGYIVDVVIDDPASGIFASLLVETLTAFRAGGADLVVMLLNPVHRLSQLMIPVLEHQRFHRRRDPKRFSMKVFAEKDRDLWCRPENWYLTGTLSEGVEY